MRKIYIQYSLDKNGVEMVWKSSDNGIYIQYSLDKNKIAIYSNANSIEIYIQYSLDKNVEMSRRGREVLLFTFNTL